MSLIIFSLFSMVEVLASPPEKQGSLSEKVGIQLLKYPQLIRPVREEEQRMKELLHRIALLKDDDFIWLQADTGGIRLWSINKDNVLKASAPVYFPDAHEYFVSHGASISPEKMEPDILRQWKEMKARSVQLDQELSLVVKTLYKTLKCAIHRHRFTSCNFKSNL